MSKPKTKQHKRKLLLLKTKPRNPLVVLVMQKAVKKHKDKRKNKQKHKQKTKEEIYE